MTLATKGLIMTFGILLCFAVAPFAFADACPETCGHLTMGRTTAVVVGCATRGTAVGQHPAGLAGSAATRAFESFHRSWAQTAALVAPKNTAPLRI